MNHSERQALVNNISTEDLGKIQAKNAVEYPVYEEDLVFAEVLERWGWQAYLDISNDIPVLDGEPLKKRELMTLLAASRKLDTLKLYTTAQAVFVGAGSAQSKTPAKSFKTLTGKMLKSIEADV